MGPRCGCPTIQDVNALSWLTVTGRTGRCVIHQRQRSASFCCFPGLDERNNGGGTFPAFRDTCHRGVVIYSPFITENRIGELHTALLSCADRGVQVFVVTKTQGERSKGERATYSDLLMTLESWGVA